MSDHNHAGPPVPAGQQPDGVALIAAERRRQVEAEGYMPDHDSEHVNGDLAKAAVVYALSTIRPPENTGQPFWTIAGWWPPHWTFKPAGKVRMLVKAGALIAAEIDRLQAVEVPGE